MASGLCNACLSALFRFVTVAPETTKPVVRWMSFDMNKEQLGELDAEIRARKVRTP